MNQPPKNPRPDPGEFDAIEMAAADWFARQEFGLSPVEQARFEEWLRADPRHAGIFEELQKTSRVLDRWTEILPERTSPSMEPSAAPIVGSPRSRWLMPAGIAAAAALVVAAGFGWRSMLPDRGPYGLTASTEIGGLRSVHLPDGTTVQLNTDTEIKVRYSGTERRVQLARGEASFIVAHNRSRPFFVDADGVSVRAVGTAFNVRLRGESVEVLVTDGRVRVDDTAKGGTLLAPAAPPRAEKPEEILSAGQRVIVPVANALPLAPALATEIAPAQRVQALAWQDRRLKFDAVPLSEVVAEFNRYNRHKLVIEGPKLAAQKFGGTFRPEHYETLLSLLEQSFDVVVDRREHTTVLRDRGNE